jgi:ATP-dependent RNA helicase DeaD
MRARPPEPAMTDPTADRPGFAGLGLPPAILTALADLGYEAPSPIQAATIPLLLAGRDVVGQAQTGTGKTAAFALPLLAGRATAPVPGAGPTALVLTPTRELAIQVAEAFQRYARHLPGFHVLPIYGGQAYGPQLGALRRGLDVVVGTPGRVLDHLERGSLDLGGLRTLVLDEGDEMLRMGFIDAVEAIIGRTPPDRQVALFSATMPAEIRRIARTHLRDPAEVTIRAATSTAPTIRQRCWMVSGLHKLDALTRILEVEPFDAMLIFVRTRLETEDLAGRLAARGFAAAALSGDLPQAQRERTVGRLKDGDLDIIVATDVAARGLDVERISHVLNYDIPYDVEAYVHRIGRTGRAGRAGEAILFVTHREQRLLRAIEKATRQPIEPMALPTVAAVNDQRLARFKERITAALADRDLTDYRTLVDSYAAEHGVPPTDIAAALASLAQGDQPLLLAEATPPAGAGRPRTGPAPARGRDERGRDERGRDERGPRRERGPSGPPPTGLVPYWIGVGHEHGVKPGNIVGAIANEAGIGNRAIGRVAINAQWSIVELPADLPPETLAHLQHVWVAGRQLRIRPDRDAPGGGAAAGAGPGASRRRPPERGEPAADGTDRPRGRRPGPGGPPGRGFVRRGPAKGPGKGPGAGGPRRKPPRD